MAMQKNTQQRKPMPPGAKVGIVVGLGAVALVVILSLTLIPGISSGMTFGTRVQSKAPITLSGDNLTALGTKLWQPNSMYTWFRFDNEVPSNQLNATYQKFVKAVSPSGGLIYAPMNQQMFLVIAALKQYANITISPADIGIGNLFFFKNAAFREFHYIKMLAATITIYEDMTTTDWVMFQPKGIPFAYLVPSISFDAPLAISSGLFGVSYTIQ